MRNASTTLSIIALFALLACHSGNGGLVGNTRGMPSSTERATVQVDVFAQSLPTIVDEQVPDQPSVDLQSALETSDWRERTSARTADVVEMIYAERDFAPVFVSEAGLSEAGQVVLATLNDSWAHALRPLDYDVDHISAALEQLSESVAFTADTTPVVLGDEDRQSLIEWLAGRSDLLDMEPELLQAELNQLVTSPPSDAPDLLPEARAELERRVGAISDTENATVEAELALAAGFLDYAYDMRYFNAVWYERDLREDEVLVEEATHAALLNAFRAGAETGFASVIDALPPPYEQYPRLVEAHRRYRQIVEEGGWESNLEEEELRLRRRNDLVVPLRLRLHAEGYFDGDLEADTFDRDLRDALKHYQETHQWRDNGRLSQGVANSLNTPALRRARQIAVMLQRWRESQIGDEQVYVFVNIPDFHAEFWRDGNRDMRFRIIVGDTQRYRDEETNELVFAHATPELDRPMRFVVFNPFWNVPRSIMLTEYDPHLEENPNWYKDNGYEVLHNDNGTRWVRQRPGPDNALGVVKFLFPNEHDVYLHDTPLRNLFNRTTRSFSHGCMRIENPMDLAYYIMEHDRGWDVERVDEERASGTEQWVTLRNPIPVHVDYYVARVDDDGFVHFASDLYRRDQPRLAEVTRREEADAVNDAMNAIQAGLMSASVVNSSSPEDTASADASDPEQTPEPETMVAD